MHKIWGRFVKLYRWTATPYTDRTARFDLVLWSLATAMAVGSLVLDILNPVGLWTYLVNGVVLLFDVAMLRQAIRGIAYRRRMRKMEEQVLQMVFGPEG
jgi:hypothetical protein